MERARWIRDGGRGRDGDRINKTLRFCRRCIDVVFILSSLMSTCELDRFVIQTPYIKVLKSCSAPFVDRAGIDDDSGIDGRTYGRTYGRTDERTDRRNERERRWINEKPVSSLRSWIPATLVSQYAEKGREGGRGPYPYADNSPAPSCRCIFKTPYVSCI